MNFNPFAFIPLLISVLPFLLIFFAVILVIYCWKAHVRIKFKSFKGKGFRPKRGKFGTYCYVGKQGKGKTYSLVEYLIDNNNKIQVFSNIHNISNVSNITYFTGFKELIEIKDKIDMASYFKRDFIIFHNKKLNLSDKQLVFVYDEIFTELQKKSPVTKSVMDFLCQMRKRQIIFLTTAQEWPEIPLTFRRFCRYQIDCNMVPIFTTGFLIKTFRDAENMKWDNDEQEHIAPITETTITKCRKFIADSYDTRLRVSSVVMPEESAVSSLTSQGSKQQGIAQIPTFLRKE